MHHFLKKGHVLLEKKTENEKKNEAQTNTDKESSGGLMAQGMALFGVGNKEKNQNTNTHGHTGSNGIDPIFILFLDAVA